MKLYLPKTNEKLAQLHALGFPKVEGVELAPLKAIEPNRENGLDKVNERRKAALKAQR